jgi:hypothetical protein
LILYDKDTNFLGASADVLSTLGYEDINVFKAYNNDVADLFVNRQGYVHKFDNFSWISYVLNGSLPNKNVIVKTRNGGEIEASISITELFLSSKDDRCYLVSLSNIRKISDSADNAGNKDELYGKQPIFKIDNNDSRQPIFTEQQTVDSSTQEFVAQNEKISFTFNNEDLKPIVPTTPSTSSASEEDLKNEKITVGNLSTATTQQIQPNVEVDNANVIEIKIDVQEISDLLGIDKADIVKYLKEYVSYLDVNLNQLQELYKNGNSTQTRRIVVNLIGIGSNLRSKELVQALQKLLIVGSGTHITSTLKEIETIFSAFKQSVSKL